MENKKELDLDDVEQVSGGAIVELDHADKMGRYAIIDDHNGRVLGMAADRQSAEKAAVNHFNTTDVLITPKDYAGLYGKKIETY